MLELQKALLLVVLSLCGWSILALLLDKRGQRQINQCLAWILLSLCLPLAYFYSRLLASPDGLPLLSFAALAAIWLKGPFLWLMVHLVVGRPVSLPVVHFAPFLLVALMLVFKPAWLMALGQLGLLQALVYLLLSLQLLRLSRARLLRIYREFPNTSYYWLLWVVAGLLVVMLVDFVLMGLIFVRQILLLDLIEIMSWCIAGYLLSISFFSVYRPQIFFHQARQGDASLVAAEAIEAAQVIQEKTWRELDESLARQLALQLEQLMERDSLYRQGELSLAQLAERLGVSVHQASELLNVHLGLSFYDYLNRYRLDYACALLRNPGCEWRILDVVFESGFSTKNSFYRCFRAAYGITPAEYRNRHLDKGLASAQV